LAEWSELYFVLVLMRMYVCDWAQKYNNSAAT
jgi:hypothetical protein